MFSLIMQNDNLKPNFFKIKRELNTPDMVFFRDHILFEMEWSRLILVARNPTVWLVFLLGVCRSL